MDREDSPAWLGRLLNKAAKNEKNKLLNEAFPDVPGSSRVLPSGCNLSGTFPVKPSLCGLRKYAQN